MYRLIGESISHSYSQEIYEELGYDYGILDLREDKFENFMRNRVFKGINITIPYKELVRKHLDIEDEIASRIGVVNTVLKKDNQLIGYNTDYFGLKYLIEKNEIEVLNKNVLILGTGATSKTAAAVFRDLKANEIVKVSRTFTKNSITYDDLDSVKDFDIIVNTTPSGMFPDSGESLIDLSLFTKLEAVVDVIYNPLKTKLVIDALKLNIKAVGGLEMLVAQAFESARLFFDEDFNNEDIDKAYQKMVMKKMNVVLIGMPTAGKTTIARKLAKKLNKDFKDVDHIIVERQGKTIREIFTHDGEDFFRMLESTIIKELSHLTNTIIASGGGSILDSENVDWLKGNGLLVFVDRPLELLYAEQSRPLTASDDNLENIYKDRYQTYKDVSDVVVVNDESLDQVVNEILEAIKCAY